MARRVSLRRRPGTPGQPPVVVPPDPIATLDGPFDAPVASTWLLEIADGQVVGGAFVERPAS